MYRSCVAHFAFAESNAVYFFGRHMHGGSLPPQAPAPPVGYVSSTMVSDLETDLPDEDEEEDDEEDEGYGARHPRGIEHTPGSSMDNLDSSLTGTAHGPMNSFLFYF